MNKTLGLLTAALILAGTPGLVRAQTPIVQFNFNETGTSAADSGSDATAATLNSAGTATDLHSASGTGVSNTAGDEAFDGTSASTMGNSASGGQALLTAAVPALESLESFTLTGWFKTDGSEVIGSGARLFSQPGTGAGFSLNGDNATAGKLDLTVNGTVIASTAASYTTAGQWTFFAVTYNGTATSSNVKFYIGNSASSVTLASTVSLNKGTEVSPNAALSIGQTAAGAASFDGLLDDMAVYGSSTDASGALTLSQLDTIRLADLSAVPEPSDLALVACGAVALLCGWRRRAVLLG